MIPILLMIRPVTYLQISNLPMHCPECRVRAAGNLLKGHVVDLGAQVEHEEDEDALQRGGGL